MGRHGFSLIELLVVIAIIALLLGVLSPSLWSARHQAQGVVCSSNIKQLSFALTVYEQSHGGFPNGLDDRPGLATPVGGYPGDSLYDKNGTWWFHQLDGVISDPLARDSATWCASRKVKDTGLIANILLGNYGVNRAICTDVQGPAGSPFVGRPLTSAQIPHPAAVLLVADSGYSLISWQAAADNVLQRAENHEKREMEMYVPGLSINGNRAFSPACEEDALEGRHRGRIVNAAYTDGHIDSVPAETLLVEDVGGCWRNRSPLWLP
jgi:prepilin-type N-terminal cleavage/methylation domain-containing protein/prepilin-type processing-associated H-X9-DG protein